MNNGCRVALEAWRACRNKGRGPKGRAGPGTLQEIVAAYRKYCQRGAKAEQDYYANLPTLEEAIERAARAERPDGKRHDHQRRLSRSSLEQVRKNLSKTAIQSCETFGDLHSLIERTIRPVRGIGELMVYDTAIRIGARMRLEPEVVYLHSGTRLGARALGFDTSLGFITISKVPSELKALKPREIEDCLCIFKDDLFHICA